MLGGACIGWPVPVVCEALSTETEGVTMSYSQRLALMVYRAVGRPDQGAAFPYGFEAYAKAAASCKGKRLQPRKAVTTNSNGGF